MKRKIYFIFDDSLKPPFSIRSIVGDRSYGQIIHKRVKLEEKIRTQIKCVEIEKFIEILNVEDRIEVLKQLKEESGNSIYIHFFSKAVVIDPEKFSVLMQKIAYSQSININQEYDPFMLVFPSVSEYEDYLKLLEKNQTITKSDLGKDTLVITPDGFGMDISNISSFLNFFSGGFEARYFNQLIGDEYILVKKSVDKQKIEKEYKYYQLIPDIMKKWFVMPYDFKADEKYASYTMERLNVPDMALQWIHNSVSVLDYNVFLDKIFSFVTSRPSRKITKKEYLSRFYELYYQKVFDRIERLKEHKDYEKIYMYVLNGTGYTIEKIINDYNLLYQKLEKELVETYEVIGHGDLCFSNILYDKNSYMMKFIDTKGALFEEDLWTDPYYDLAKLSHSILGKYDFINNELFTITLDNTLSLQIGLKSRDLNMFQKLFIEKVKQVGFDIRLVRLCEASLFLSMVPLHVDNLRKVLGFILNGIQIIEELEKNVG